jgi:signal peptidase
MKRAAAIVGNIIFYLILASILLSVGSQQLMGRAWGWSMVSGSSMVPTLERGDYVLIVPYFAGRSSPPQVGDVIAFEDENKNPIIHRIVDTTETGYITRGDANPDIDPSPVMPGKINGVALTLGSQVARVPVIGSLALKVMTPQIRLPLILGVLALITILLVFYIFRWRREKPRVRLRLMGKGELKGFYSRHRTVFNYSGITILGALILMSAMVKMSSTMDFCYGVVETESETMVTSGGINLGVITVDSQQSRDLVMSGNFPITMLAVFVDQDDAISFPQNPAVIPSRQDIVVESVVAPKIDNIGIHTTPVTVLFFPPVLPGGIIYKLAQYHQLLAMFIISVVLMLALTIPAGIAEHWLGKETKRQMIRRLRRRKE